MPEERESGHKLAGRLYATLRVLKFLAKPGSPKPTAEDEFTTKDSPRQRIQALKLDLFEDLLSATQRAGRAEAAGEVFRAIPAVVPPHTALHYTINDRELAEFNAGHRAQLAKLKEALPNLL